MASYSTEHRFDVCRRLLVGGLLLLASACQSEKNGSAAQDERYSKLVTKSVEAQLADSLRKYRHLTEFLQEGDSNRYVLYGNMLNGQPLGVAAITDSLLLVFQQQGRHYVPTVRCSFPESATDFEIINLNGDEKDDFIVYGFANMHGQRRPYVFLSDSAGVVHYRPDLSLYNIAYNPRKKQLLSFYVGGVNSLHSKEVRRWQGDSAKLVAGAEYDMYSGSLELYRMCNEKKCYRKLYPETLRDTALRSQHEAVYDTALFELY